MKYTYDDLNVERIRKRKRELRRRQERIRKLKIYSLLLVCVVIAIIIIGISVGEGDEDNKNSANIRPSSDYVDTNAMEQSGVNSPNEDAIGGENGIHGDTLPAEKYANYGDDLYNDGRFIVCIDPGHGSNDAGCIGIDGTYEKDDALKLAKLLKYQLEKLGITVVMTRSTDVWVDLTDRPAFANEQKADLLISLHRNNYQDDSVKGFEAWINSYDSDNSYEVAQMVMSRLESVGISCNRGVKRGTMDNETDYRVNSDSSMPSILLEMGFMSSPTDNRLYKEKISDYAKAIAEAVDEWYQDKSY